MRDISLYINGRKADISPDAPLLWSKAMTEMDNPSVITNSYSQPLTLDGTPTNRSIFASIDRLDYRPQEGLFNPRVRIPFELRCNGALTQSGYLRLDSVTKGATPSFNITLYGGLGRLLYELTYNDEGEEMSLNDLPWDDDYDFDFRMSKETIRDAWKALAGEAVTKYNEFQVLNFAPLYEGLPSDFDAKRMLFRPSDTLNPETMQDGGETFATIGGKSLADLNSERDNWDCKEFRSYLLRPVINIYEVLVKINEYLNRRGYGLEWDFRGKSPLFDRDDTAMWMTLPRPSEKNATKEETDSTFSNGALSLTGVMGSTTPTATNIDASALASITDIMTLGTPVVSGRGSDAYLYLYNYISDPSEAYPYKYTSLAVQSVGYDADGNVIARGGVVLLAPDSPILPANFNFQEAFDISVHGNVQGDVVEVIPVHLKRYSQASATFKWESGTTEIATLRTTLYADGVVKYGISAQWIGWQMDTAGDIMALDPNISPASVWRPMASDQTAYNVKPTPIASLRSISAHSVTQTWRTGATITQADLLGGTPSPAKVLISLCRMYGLELVQRDALGMRYALMNRNYFYNADDETEAVSLEGRVNLDHPLVKTPIPFEPRFYDFKTPAVGDAYQKEYKAKYGREYGSHSYNTGNPFSTSREDMLAGIVFRGSSVALENRPTFYNVTESGKSIPSPFLFGGKYTLWKSDGTGKSFDLRTPSSYAVLTPWNAMAGYDLENVNKPMFHDEKNNPVDGSLVLLCYNGGVDYASLGFRITDDTTTMLSLNEGRPCWDATQTGIVPASVPFFTRYSEAEGESLEFGTPAEYNTPLPPEVDSIFDGYWRTMMLDRYGLNSTRLEVWVDLGILTSIDEAFRKRYTYGGQEWALESVESYDVTRRERYTKCTFIHTDDWTNY